MAQKRIECLDKILQFIHEVKKQFPIEAVYLFGSQATGHAKKDSDIDLIVVAKYFESQKPLDRLVLLGRIAWRAETPEIEAIGYTPDEFNNAKPWDFPAEIRHSGIFIASH